MNLKKVKVPKEGHSDKKTLGGSNTDSYKLIRNGEMVNVESVPPTCFDLNPILGPSN
jgi:hypothetical protein